MRWPAGGVTTATAEADHRCAGDWRTLPTQACVCADQVAVVNLEDVWRIWQGTTTVTSGPLRSALVWRMTSADGSDQYRLNAWSLDGMQGVRRHWPEVAYQFSAECCGPQGRR
jgi:hypothetical protein